MEDIIYKGLGGYWYFGCNLKTNIKSKKVMMLKDGTEVSLEAWEYLKQWNIKNNSVYLGMHFKGKTAISDLTAKEFAQVWEYAISKEQFIPPKEENPCFKGDNWESILLEILQKDLGFITEIGYTDPKPYIGDPGDLRNFRFPEQVLHITLVMRKPITLKIG